MVSGIQFVEDGSMITGGADGFIKVWDTDHQLKSSVMAHDSYISAISYKGGILASSSGDKTIKIWSLE